MNIFLRSILSISILFLQSTQATEPHTTSKSTITPNPNVLPIIQHLATAECPPASQQNYSRIRFKPKGQHTLPLSLSIERAWFQDLTTGEFDTSFDPEKGFIAYFASKETYTISDKGALALSEKFLIKKIGFRKYSAFVKEANRKHAAHQSTFIKKFGQEPIPQAAYHGSTRVHGPFLATTTKEGITKVYRYTAPSEK